MSKLDDQISTLQSKLAQLKVRQQRIDARTRALASRRARKDDTRRKILVGAIVMTKVEQGEMDQTQLQRWLDRALVRPDDRALFELLPQVAPPDLNGTNDAHAKSAGE